MKESQKTKTGMADSSILVNLHKLDKSTACSVMGALTHTFQGEKKRPAIGGSIEIVFLRLQGNLLGIVTCGELVTWNWDQQFLASALGLVLKLIRTALFERNREAMGSEVNGGGGKDLPL